MKKSKQKLFCAFVDFSQAFDSIWRGGLFRKLHFNSIQGKFLRIICNMYENIKSCVKISGESSQFLLVTAVFDKAKTYPQYFFQFI